MKKLSVFVLMISSTQLLAVCEDAKLNKTDKIYEGYLCTPTSIIGAQKIENLCIIRAKTAPDEEKIYEYTHMQTVATGENGWENNYSTFKWHHKKNSSVAKMWETDSKIKMKDITAADFMRANIYKVSEFQKKTKSLTIEVYKKKTFIGLKKRKWYSASFNCQKIDENSSMDSLKTKNIL